MVKPTLADAWACSEQGWHANLLQDLLDTCSRQQARLSLLAWLGKAIWQTLGPAHRQAGRHTCCKTSSMLAPYSNCSLSPSSLLFSSLSLLHMPIIWELG